jgi:hypothetical protein
VHVNEVAAVEPHVTMSLLEKKRADFDEPLRALGVVDGA